MSTSIQLRLLGITYNQIDNGVYALILEEIGGNRRMPIIIGYPEAQAIECRLQSVNTPRPLTHDIMATLIDTLEAKLNKVDIRKLKNGVFAAYLDITDNLGRNYRLDSRSSDAIALAIRMGAPIYTTEAVLAESGFTPEKSDSKNSDDKDPAVKTRHTPESLNKKEKYELMSKAELEQKLSELVADEKYEEAAKIKKILESK